MPDRQLRMCGCAQWTSLKTLSAQTGTANPRALDETTANVRVWLALRRAPQLTPTNK